MLTRTSTVTHYALLIAKFVEWLQAKLHVTISPYMLVCLPTFVLIKSLSYLILITSSNLYLRTNTKVLLRLLSTTIGINLALFFGRNGDSL